MLPGQHYRDESFPLELGDIVVLMTDGIVEALHRESDQLGMFALLDIIGSAPRNIAEINRRILDAVEKCSHGAILDDLTLLTIEVTPRIG
jgi:serine phosphatase RsbU (regulator of sigma subunit)